MQSITPNVKKINSQSTVVSSVTTRNTNLHHINSNDLLAGILNTQIAKNIDSYFRLFSKMEIEVIKYLNYYFKKWDGNIQIPIKNLMARFDCSARWIHQILARIYDAGWVITIKQGFGRKVTKRTLTERGKLMITALVKGFGSAKQLINKRSADYCADYSGDHTKYISSEVDIVQGETYSFPTENNKTVASECLRRMREEMRKRKNE